MEGEPTHNFITSTAPEIILEMELALYKTQDDPLQRQPDISLAKEKLQWEPDKTLDEGLQTTIAYFKTALKED